MKILVTGGAGFIGSNFIKYEFIAHPDDTIICVDKFTYAGHMKNLSSVSGDPNFKLYIKDICDLKEMDKIFAAEKPDIVVNFAAESNVDFSIAEPELFIKTNIIGTSDLLNVSYKYGVKRFHQISTDEVYGDLPPVKYGPSFREGSEIHPNNPYSVSKASADFLVLAFERAYGLNISISRSVNNYGMNQNDDKLIPKMVKCALSGKDLSIYGDGTNIRDWMYVIDHCKAVDMIIRDERTAGEVYNVGAGFEMDNNEIAEMICDEAGISHDRITHVEDRKGHDLRYALNADKIKNELGWKAELSTRDRLISTIQWYINIFRREERTEE